MSKLSTEENDLFREDSTYKRDLDIIGNYIDKESTLLSIRTGKSKAECTTFIASKIKEKAEKDVEMKVLRKAANGDRIKAKVGFIQYLNWVMKSGNIMAPNMITYASKDKIPSYSSMFIHMNINKRSDVKGKAKRAKQLSQSEKDEKKKKAYLDAAYSFNLEQGNCKFFNNSASGAGSSEHNALYFLSKHTTLTSGCRACTSTANSINEKLIASNRHYYSYEVTMHAIAYICSEADLTMIEAAMVKYDMHVPTVEETFALITRSAKMYWRNPTLVSQIKSTIENLTDVQRAAVCYVNDLNAMFELSDSSIRQFFDELIDPSYRAEHDEEVRMKGSEDIYALVGMLCYDYMKGLSANDLKEKDPAKYQDYVNTYGNTIAVLIRWRDFLQAFFINNVLPQNVFEIPNSVRIAVPASDTDSSIYTTERIVGHYNKKVDFSGPAISAGAVVAFISASMIAHSMLKLSRQIGVSEDQKYRIAMKGEYFFPVLLCTNLTKHYAYLEAAQEGNIYKKAKLDIKGVQLKNSKLPTRVRDKSLEWYEMLLNRIYNDQVLTPDMVKAYPAYVEHYTTEQIATGSIAYYSMESIKPEKNYKKPMSSNYQYVDLWNNVFASKYGEVTELPGKAIKLPVKLANIQAITAWAETLEPRIKDALLEWVGRNGKKKFTNLLVPIATLPGGKVPKEFLPIVDIRTLLNQNIAHCYIFMTTFGIQIQNAKGTRLASDDLTMEEAKEYMAQMDFATLD